MTGDDREIFGHLLDFVDGLLDSLPNRFPSGMTSLQEFSAAQKKVEVDLLGGDLGSSPVHEFVTSGPNP